MNLISICVCNGAAVYVAIAWPGTSYNVTTIKEVVETRLVLVFFVK
jgi:hypothetical protein